MKKLKISALILSVLLGACSKNNLEESVIQSTTKGIDKNTRTTNFVHFALDRLPNGTGRFFLGLVTPNVYNPLNGATDNFFRENTTGVTLKDVVGLMVVKVSGVPVYINVLCRGTSATGNWQIWRSSGTANQMVPFITSLPGIAPSDKLLDLTHDPITNTFFTIRNNTIISSFSYNATGSPSNLSFGNIAPLLPFGFTSMSGIEITKLPTPTLQSLLLFGSNTSGSSFGIIRTPSTPFATTTGLIFQPVTFTGPGGTLADDKPYDVSIESKNLIISGPAPLLFSSGQRNGQSTTGTIPAISNISSFSGVLNIIDTDEKY